MRFSDWLVGIVSCGGQSNSDVPHSGYFEELRVRTFVLLVCVSFCSVHGFSFSRLERKSKILLNLSIFHNVAFIIFRLCGRSRARQ